MRSCQHPDFLFLRRRCRAPPFDWSTPLGTVMVAHASWRMGCPTSTVAHRGREGGLRGRPAPAEPPHSGGGRAGVGPPGRLLRHHSAGVRHHLTGVCSGRWVDHLLETTGLPPTSGRPGAGHPCTGCAVGLDHHLVRRDEDPGPLVSGGRRQPRPSCADRADGARVGRVGGHRPDGNQPGPVGRDRHQRSSPSRVQRPDLDPRGFGDSTGLAEVDSPAFEAKDVSRLIDWVATRPGVELDAPGDPRMGMVGGSYGGGIQWVTAAQDCRIDAIVPTISWHSFRYQPPQDRHLQVRMGQPSAGGGRLRPPRPAHPGRRRPGQRHRDHLAVQRGVVPGPRAGRPGQGHPHPHPHRAGDGGHPVHTR